MTRTPFDTGQFLEWLGKILSAAEGVDVDVERFIITRESPHEFARYVKDLQNHRSR